MASIRADSHESRTLQRLFEITQDIRQAHDIGPVLDSIAVGLSELYGWRYVSIVASDAPGGELYRRAMIGFPAETRESRLGEHIPREAIRNLLKPQYEVVPHCFFIQAERRQEWAYDIEPSNVLPEKARSDEGAWHEQDSLALVLTDRGGEMLGYISVDGPIDGRVPSQETLREMQLFVNLVGLALGKEQTSREQTEFFTIVAHEVRSPLAAIGGATSLLDSHFDSLTPQRRGEILTVLSSSTARLSAIFEDFLLLSRMDAGKLTLREDSVDPISVVEESVARIQSEHPSRTFRTVYLAPIPSVRADEGRVVQILTNVLSNAAKYATPESVIAVELKPYDDRVWFAVKNEGPGISPADRPKVFTRFGRLRRDSDSSIGLGLYICAQLVSMMGGTIGFDSEPGKITTFWFTLPR